MSSWLSWSPFTTSETSLQAWVRSILEANNIDKQKISDTSLKLKDEQMETLLLEYKNGTIEKFLKEEKKIITGHFLFIKGAIRDEIEKKVNEASFPVPTSVQYSAEFPVKIHHFEYPKEVPKEERLFPPLIIDHANLEEQTLKWLNSNFKSNTQRRHYRPAIIRGLVKTGKSAWQNHALPGIIMNYEPLKNVKKHFFRFDFDQAAKKIDPNSKNPFSELLEIFLSNLLLQFKLQIPVEIHSSFVHVKVKWVFDTLRSNDNDLYVFLYDELQAYFNLDPDTTHAFFKISISFWAFILLYGIRHNSNFTRSEKHDSQ